MKLKAFIALLACTCLLLPLYACNGSDEASGSGAGASSAAESGYIYKSDSVEVVPLKGDEVRNFTFYNWAELEPEEVFTRAAALCGTVSNIREAKVLYKSDGEDKEGQITLFDLTVKDILFSKKGSVTVGDTVTVTLDYNTTVHDGELPVLTEGEDCIAFLDLSSEMAESYPLLAEADKYSDYYAYDPNQLLCEKVGDGYITRAFFGEALHAPSIYELLGLNDTLIDTLRANDPNRKIEDVRAAARSNLPHGSALEQAGCEAMGNIFLRTYHQGDVRFLSKTTNIIEAKALEDYIRTEAGKY